MNVTTASQHLAILITCFPVVLVAFEPSFLLPPPPLPLPPPAPAPPPPPPLPPSCVDEDDTVDVDDCFEVDNRSELQIRKRKN